MDWYYMKNGEQHGPVQLDDLKALVAEGTLNKDSFIWNKPMGDKWCKVSDIPVLAGPREDLDKPEVKADFDLKLKERESAVAKQRAEGIRNALLGAAVVIAAIAGVVMFIKTAPQREFGVSGSNRIGSLKKIEGMLVGKFKMSRTEMPSYEFYGKTAHKLYEYKEPKVTEGEHVSGKGTIVIAVNDKDTPVAMIGSFPSPGLRGNQMNNKCVAGIFLNDIWKALGGKEQKALLVKNEMWSRVDADCGFVKVPDDSVCELLPGRGMQGIWCEFGPNTRYSLVYFEAK